MNITNKLGNFLENFGNPFFLGSIAENRVIFVNKKAQELFGCTVESCKLEDIFQKTTERIRAMVDKVMNPEKPTLINNFTAITGTGEEIVVDMLFGFFDEEKTEVFLEVIPQQDTRLNIAMHHISLSPRPEAILNLDDDLSIVYCNDPFHEVFHSSEEVRHTHFENRLVNGFLPEVRASLMAELKESLRIGRQFSKKIKVFTAKGEERWYLMELEKRALDNSVEQKLIAYMTNIEKQVEMEEEVAQLNKYFNALQSVTGESLYTVDVKNKILRQTGHVAEELGFSGDIGDFPESLLYKVHPESLEQYKKFTYDSMNGTAGSTEVYIQTQKGDFQWYAISCEIIRNDYGEVSEVIGRMNNIQKQKSMENKFSTFNQLMSALQSISGESLYSIDVKGRILRATGKAAEELGLPPEMYNFPESFLYKVHPEEKKYFTTLIEEAIRGELRHFQISIKTTKGTYNRYEIFADSIRNENDEVAEIVGKITNIGLSTLFCTTFYRTTIPKITRGDIPQTPM